MAKIDILSDGFYRVGLRIEDIPKLGVAIPTLPNCPRLVAFPLALPMGWVESPPYFTAFTEMACDLSNTALVLQTSTHAPPLHHLEDLANTPPPENARMPPIRNLPRIRAKRPAVKPLAHVDVYVDDFLLAPRTNSCHAIGLALYRFRVPSSLPRRSTYAPRTCLCPRRKC